MARDRKTAGVESKLEGVYNVRDLGGHPCGEGRVTRRGVLFRSAGTSYATASDVSVISRDLGIQTILDFRSRHDASYVGGSNLLETVYPDATAREVPPLGPSREKDRRLRVWVKIIHSKLTREIMKRGSTSRILRYFAWSLLGKIALWLVWVLRMVCGVLCTWQLQPRDLPSPLFDILQWPLLWLDTVAITRKYTLAFTSLGGMAELYKMMLEFAGDRFAQALKICASKENQPVIFHCASGKDRAGLVAFLLLRACGVPLSTCVEDFHKTDTWSVMDEHYHQISGGRGKMFRRLSSAELDAQLRAPKAFIEEANSFLDKRYGGVEAYLDSIGFDRAWRERLRETMVVKVQ
eukprot:CAMPEP_0167774302 /NCGR_PEP_ID=MMETSP0111_2-20121227/1923_1 /TAXON_ID=91324 /ORGANISM="Lotharella globosa, Strain CCCM811" /LENGTH=349 /DNA_ID=CAMNT_0007664081 /DNA_START=44 /DNA_END=1093 /DNA_ORIENTATION=-